MILYPRAFVLSEAAASRPLVNPRIGYQTWLRDLDASAITASSETAAGPKDSPLRPDTYEYWEAPTLPATWVADFGVGREIGYIGVAAHNLGTKQVACKFETTPDGTNWTLFASEQMPADDAPLLFLDGPRSSIRKIRCTLSGGVGIPKVAVINAGTLLSMERPIYGGYSPVNLARKTKLQQSMSRSGNFLAQHYRRLGVAGNAPFKNLSPSWYRENFDPFVKAARKYPFFFAWNPEEFSNDVVYAWAPSDIVPSYMGDLPLMQVDFEMVGIGNE